MGPRNSNFSRGEQEAFFRTLILERGQFKFKKQVVVEDEHEFFKNELAKF
jgi:hypothetical protein